MEDTRNWKEVQSILQRPFDPEDVSWLGGRGGKSFAYVEDRRYMERLDEAATAGGWETTLDLSQREGFVHVTCTLNVLGVSKSSTGEASVTLGSTSKINENALTTAEAQAFKRACVRFGLGRYLYDLPDNLNRSEDLPTWALPKYTCESCKTTIKNNGVFTAGQIRRRSLLSFGKELCMDCVKKESSK